MKIQKFTQIISPDWRKILLFMFLDFILGIILLAVTSLFFTSPGSSCMGCASPVSIRIMTMIFLPFGLGFFGFLHESGLLDLVHGGFPRLIALVANIFLTGVFWYFASCFIVHFYDKFKKPKTKGGF